VSNRPHDLTDLAFAPAALALDGRIAELGSLTADEVNFRVALEANTDTSNRDTRGAALIAALTQGLELHHWQAGIDPRGVRLFHDDHAIVLGLPESVRAFLDDVR